MAEHMYPPAYDADSEHVLVIKFVRSLEAIYAPSVEAGPVYDADSIRVALYKANKILEESA